MASKEQSVTLLRANKLAQVEALKSLGFDSLTESARASEFPAMVKWANGLLDLTIAANRISDNKKFFFTLAEWQSLSATEQGLFLLRGVRVRAWSTSFIIAPDTITNKQWGDKINVPDAAQPRLTHTMPFFFDAYNETKLVVEAYKDHSGNGVVGAPAAEAALAYKAFTFDRDGLEDDSEWCLPTLAHWFIIFRFKTEIDAMFTAVWSSDFKIQSVMHWACLQLDSSNAYRCNVDSGSCYWQDKTNTGAVRPICLS